MLVLLLSFVLFANDAFKYDVVNVTTYSVVRFLFNVCWKLAPFIQIKIVYH